MATAPLGGDITLAQETVLALIGVVIPNASLEMTGHCVISGVTLACVYLLRHPPITTTINTTTTTIITTTGMTIMGKR